MQTRAKRFFDESMKKLYDLDVIYDYLNRTNCIINQDALLRSHFVLGVSSFDTYFHTLILDALMADYRRNEFDSLRYIDITLGDIASLIKMKDDDLAKEQAILAAIRKGLSKDSFQSPKSIEYAMNMIKIRNIWSKISGINGISRISGVASEDIKKELSVIILRRNKIAHESDYDYVNMNYLPIQRRDVDDACGFLIAFVEAVDALVCSRG